ncbi:MAG TPA: hypothetical protein PLG34_10330 [Spirochaetota bacterium]|nr:MAG: hypothetical protein BWX91_02383 [Spirochaetes bacterium ADurb.Bin133]HNZ27023.1 hypothetical protein [Spirochaetota bacterium]HPY88368.1 hypothetical protein [Spirochaetota bacterium]HQB61219.1 hypothetical protein [Spirochaetota bacterium]
MKRFIKRLLFVLFFQLIFFLTVFYVADAKYYPIWLVSFVLFLLLNIFASVKFIPSKRKENEFKNLASEYKAVTASRSDIKIKAMKLEFVCPNCSNKNNFWTFLDNFECDNCNSGLWSSKLSEYEKVYDSLFKEKEKIDSFFDSLSPSMKKKLKEYKPVG